MHIVLYTKCMCIWIYGNPEQSIILSKFGQWVASHISSGCNVQFVIDYLEYNFV